MRKLLLLLSKKLKEWEPKLQEYARASSYAIHR